MAAFGPDFKKEFVDVAPISNADVAPTLAQILGLSLKSNGKLNGRVLTEALAGEKQLKMSKPRIAVSQAAANGNVTVLMYQEFGKQVYFDQACFEKPTAPKSKVACPN
jgi:hypothetical protein